MGKFKISHEIDSITGATISVESINRAVKKSLAILHFKINVYNKNELK